MEVRIEETALATFGAHRQTRFYHREAGGQLFGHVGRMWTVAVATGPGKADQRWRFAFRPDRAREQREIHELHARGFDYLGDWHTHPEDAPEPSPRDLTSIGDIVKQSTHHLPGFLLCIVGRTSFPTGLWLSFHTPDGSSMRAVPEPVSQAVPCP
jgi:integrative and conjugative element protein (TIGR02256 family)